MTLSAQEQLKPITPTIHENGGIIMDEEAALDYLATLLVEAYFAQKGYERTKSKH